MQRKLRQVNTGCTNKKQARSKIFTKNLFFNFSNKIFSGALLSDIHQLQMVQNYAARLLTFHRKRDHITPILQDLHWLPVASRFDFKVLLFMYKSLNSLAPAYLTDKIKRLQPSRSLRSCNGYKAMVSRAHKVRLGDRAFSIIGPSRKL